MEVDREEIQQMADEIHESQEILTALGDHMRLHRFFLSGQKGGKFR